MFLLYVSYSNEHTQITCYLDFQNIVVKNPCPWPFSKNSFRALFLSKKSLLPSIFFGKMYFSLFSRNICLRTLYWWSLPGYPINFDHSLRCCLQKKLQDSKSYVHQFGKKYPFPLDPAEPTDRTPYRFFTLVCFSNLEMWGWCCFRFVVVIFFMTLLSFKQTVWQAWQVLLGTTLFTNSLGDSVSVFEFVERPSLWVNVLKNTRTG